MSLPFALALFLVGVAPLAGLIIWLHTDRARARAAHVWPYGPAVGAVQYSLGPVRDIPIVEPPGVPNGD